MPRYIGVNLLLAGTLVTVGSCVISVVALPSVFTALLEHAAGVGGRAQSVNVLIMVIGVGFAVGVGLVLLGLVATILEGLADWLEARRSQ